MSGEHAITIYCDGRRCKAKIDVSTKCTTFDDYDDTNEVECLMWEMAKDNGWEIDQTDARALCSLCADKERDDDAN